MYALAGSALQMIVADFIRYSVDFQRWKATLKLPFSNSLCRIPAGAHEKRGKKGEKGEKGKRRNAFVIFIFF